MIVGVENEKAVYGSSYVKSYGHMFAKDAVYVRSENRMYFHDDFKDGEKLSFVELDKRPRVSYDGYAWYESKETGKRLLINVSEIIKDQSMEMLHPDRAAYLVHQAIQLALKEGPDMVAAMVKEMGISEEELSFVGYDKEDYPEIKEALDDESAGKESRKEEIDESEMPWQY